MINSRWNRIQWIIILLFCFLQINNSMAQVPVADFWGRSLSKTTSVVQQASEIITKIAAPLVETFGDIQEFFQKAETVVNGVVRNMRIIQDIVDLEEDISVYFETAIEQINRPRDNDLDGEDDLYFLNKWKHIQILLALSQEATGVVGVFTNLLEEEAFTMDDKNRIEFIKRTRDGLRRIKTAMRIQMRRINREIAAFGALDRERKTFEKLFETN